ncbi:DUF6624 domain-containing protein [Streptomyces sp. ODS28]|uniref:DUF6624 domain-containing protein n=1 Tax=Streptomyces sp. ODS28 TaxID=3136688 RepID=UPI0031E68B5A
MDAIEPDHAELDADAEYEGDLAQELCRMAEEDHAAAHLANSADFTDQLAWRRIAAQHGDRLLQILQEHGWPTASRVGPDASRAAWLLAQHADRQLEVQRLALRLLDEAVGQGEAPLDQLAFLYDRTRVNEGREQLYGTQIAGVDASGAPIPWPCEDPERMDERRVEVGIEPFGVYTARFGTSG